MWRIRCQRANYSVSNRANGQVLCPGRDSYCVPRRRKSLFSNARRDSYYVSHHKSRTRQEAGELRISPASRKRQRPEQSLTHPQSHSTRLQSPTLPARRAQKNRPHFLQKETMSRFTDGIQDLAFSFFEQEESFFRAAFSHAAETLARGELAWRWAGCVKREGLRGEKLRDDCCVNRVSAPTFGRHARYERLRGDDRECDARG